MTPNPVGDDAKSGNPMRPNPVSNDDKVGGLTIEEPLNITIERTHTESVCIFR